MRLLAVFILSVLAAFAQNVAKFPGAAVTWQDLLIAKPPARATLTAGIAIDAVAIPVTDGTQYAPYSAVQIQEEVILVCSITGNTLNVCPGGRGFSGTVAAPHGIYAGVRNTVTTHHHNQLAAEVKAIEDALGPNLSNVTATTSWEALTGKPTTFVFTDQAYSDPTWLTRTWDGVSGKPTTFTPASHTHGSVDLTAGTYGINISGNAATVTGGVYTSGAYTDPSWLMLTKAKVGLGSVEDTALSTWAGSGNITTLGTISSGTVPWARLSNVPGTFTPATHAHAIGDLSTVGDWSSKITSGTYGISITGNADTVDGLHVHAAGNTEANKIVRTDANGYLHTSYMSTTSGDAGTSPINRVYASEDAYIRYYTLPNFSKQAFNAVTHDSSWTWVDDYIALPTGTVQWGVFTPRAANATITSVVCWSDTGDASIHLRRNDGGDMLSAPLACNGTPATELGLNGFASIPVGYFVGMWATGGTAKRINAAITYTTAY